MTLLPFLLSSTAYAIEYEKVWVWQYSNPNIVVCEDANTQLQTVKEAAQFWRKKGYKIGKIKQGGHECDKDWYPRTIIIFEY